MGKICMDSPQNSVILGLNIQKRKDFTCIRRVLKDLSLMLKV